MAVRVVSRRRVLRGCLVSGLGAVAGYLTVRTSGAARSSGRTTAANAYGPPPAGGSTLLTRLDLVPQGGGLILGEQGIVLTRPSADAVHGFSAVCTHQGCTVDAVAEGTIRCPCHGSRFDVTTGAVVDGPATRALPTVEVAVRSGKVFAS